MSKTSEIIEKITNIMESRDLNIEKKRNTIKGIHVDLPIALVVKIYQNRKQAVIELESLEDLSDTLADLIESNENVEDIVDTVLSELRDAAIEITRVLETNGYMVEIKVMENEKDIRDIIYEVLEEYREFEEEE
ncbi:MAG: hypothetical protein QW607_00020 [Desulfurococcaceae archaeon]|uniref:Uncharacterized protein n=1 Tax=Staphylothermus marinus TaxID=2280 RepID=A0A7C4D6C5_STAMA